MIELGINGRFFENNWRPAREEIAFAQRAGFACLQFPGTLQGVDAERLGHMPSEVGRMLVAAGLYGVMEIVVFVDKNGRTPINGTPMDVLQANLSAIEGLGCRWVHWHIAPSAWFTPAEQVALEAALIPQLAEAVAVSKKRGFCFGLEHNEPGIPLFASPERCEQVLRAVPELKLVWDVNHAAPDQLAGYKGLISCMSMLHISDAPMPDTNHHLPLGEGSIDYKDVVGALQQAGFCGPAILEIGGLPKSGGYGRDTDEALLASRRYWETLLGA